MYDAPLARVLNGIVDCPAQVEAVGLPRFCETVPTAGGKSPVRHLYQGKEPKAAAEALLRIAAVQAGDGTWENIGVGRIYYLSGDKEKGEALFKKATGGKSGKTDWRKISRIYAQAGDLDKAVSAMEKALAFEPKDEAYQAELGAVLNLKGDRAKAEEMFAKSFKGKPEEVWNTINAAGSYVGVPPQ